MGQTSYTKSPNWNTNTVATNAGWVDQATGEVIVAGRGLTRIKAAASAINSVKLADTKTIYKAGDNLTFQVRWNEPVTVTGTPRIVFTIGGVSKNANYLSGTGTGLILFRYAVVAGDNGAIVLPAAVSLNSGTILDVVLSSESAVLTIPSTTLTETVDTTKPVLSSVAVLGGARYVTGNKIIFLATYASAVNVTTTGGTPTIDFLINGVARSASYVSGSGTVTLYFEYTVVSADSATATQVTAAAIALNGGTIADVSGNAALTGTGGIASITTGVGGTGYSTAPAVTITGDGTGAAATASVSGGAVTTIAVDTAGTNYTFATISFGGPGTGATATAAMNKATITVSSVVVNTGAAPAAATGTLGTLTSAYKVGENIDVVATWSAAQVVVGLPYVNLNINGTLRPAYYYSGSGTITWTFRYTVVEGDAATAGQFTIPSNSIVVPSGAAIKNTSDVAATITHAAPTTSAVVVDGVSPAVSTITRVSGPNYATAANLDFTVVFNKAVAVTGTPRIRIGIGENTRYANYSSGTTTTTLTFRYAIVSGDAAILPGRFEISDNFIDLNGGTILGNVAPNVPAVSPLTFRRPTVSTVTVNA